MSAFTGYCRRWMSTSTILWILLKILCQCRQCLVTLRTFDNSQSLTLTVTYITRLEMQIQILHFLFFESFIFFFSFSWGHDCLIAFNSQKLEFRSLKRIGQNKLLILKFCSKLSPSSHLHIFKQVHSHNYDRIECYIISYCFLVCFLFINTIDYLCTSSQTLVQRFTKRSLSINYNNKNIL